LHIAAEIKNCKIFEILVQAGSDLHAQDVMGKMPRIEEEASGNDDSSDDEPAKAQEVYSLESYHDSDFLYQWLKLSKLEELFSVLVKNGINEISSLTKSMLTEKDLINMKIKKVGLRLRLLQKIDEENMKQSQVRQRSQKKYPDLSDWLKINNLGQISSKLSNSGIFYIEDLLILQSKKRLAEELSLLEITEKEVFRLGVVLLRYEGESSERFIDSTLSKIEKRNFLDCGFCSAFKSIFHVNQ
jgi:hypothetical protein